MASQPISPQKAIPIVDLDNWPRYSEEVDPQSVAKMADRATGKADGNTSLEEIDRYLASHPKLPFNDLPGYAELTTPQSVDETFDQVARMAKQGFDALVNMDAELAKLGKHVDDEATYERFHDLKYKRYCLMKALDNTVGLLNGKEFPERPVDENTNARAVYDEVIRNLGPSRERVKTLQAQFETERYAAACASTRCTVLDNTLTAAQRVFSHIPGIDIDPAASELKSVRRQARRADDEAWEAGDGLATMRGSLRRIRGYFLEEFNKK